MLAWRKMWNECVKIDMEWLGSVKEDAYNRDKWRSLAIGKHLNLPQCGIECAVFYKLRFRNVKR